MVEIAPFLATITLFVVVGAVILLRPITKKLGDLLEVMTMQKGEPRAGVEEAARLRETVGALEARLSLLEERQNFTESLLSGGPIRREKEIAARGEGDPSEALPPRRD